MFPSSGASVKGELLKNKTTGARNNCSFPVKRAKELAIEGDSKHTRNALQWGEKYGAMANDIDAIHELLTNDKQLNFRRGMLEHEKQ